MSIIFQPNTVLKAEDLNEAFAQKASHAEVQAAVERLVDSAPDALDTLRELATALGDDPEFATTILEALAKKQETLASGTNIKTINGESILGAGNVHIDGFSRGQAHANALSF